jgi:hypothetical protein
MKREVTVSMKLHGTVVPGTAGARHHDGVPGGYR